MSWACGMHVEMLHTRQKAENPNGKDHLEDVGIDGRTLVKWFYKRWGEDRIGSAAS